MLDKPSKGFSPSVTKHNSDDDIVCDWIEASILFDDIRLSKAEIVDALIDLQIYIDSDFAFTYVDTLYNKLDKRASCMGSSYPFNRREHIIETKGSWSDFVDYTFCLLASVLPHYKNWREEFGLDYGKQGDLFEAITALHLELILPEWDVMKCGWSRDHSTPLNELLPDISRHLCERVGDFDYWAGKRANDAGLDVLCVRKFPDQRPGFFSLLVQCASGADWVHKLRDPNLSRWKKYIDFACTPSKAVSMRWSPESEQCAKL
ncbi:hypothetical protein [Desulfospira joergensenii]|uniref:hypothetical protein n=1 Tax=Desulfospira joergensenii TaxID=53329 RepID=UPI0003B606F2|nr:hypothetical protein [Desulfospira joergensenii]